MQLEAAELVAAPLYIFVTFCTLSVLPMSAAAISGCVLIFILNYGCRRPRYRGVCRITADITNRKLKSKLGMPPLVWAVTAVAAAVKASAAARAAAVPAKAKAKGQRKAESALESSADKDAPPDPKRAKKNNLKASEIAIQAAAEVEALTKDYEDDSHGATPVEPAPMKVAAERQRESAAAERQRVIALNKKDSEHAEELRHQEEEMKKLKLQLEKAQAKPSTPSTQTASKTGQAKEQQLSAPRKSVTLRHDFVVLHFLRVFSVLTSGNFGCVGHENPSCSR